MLSAERQGFSNRNKHLKINSLATTDQKNQIERHQQIKNVLDECNERSPTFVKKDYMWESFNPKANYGYQDNSQTSHFNQKENKGAQQKKIFQVSETKIVRPKQIVNKRSSDSISMLGASKARRIEDSQHHQMVYEQAQTFKTGQTQYVNVQQQLKTIKQGGTFQNNIYDISSELEQGNMILLTSAQNQPLSLNDTYKPQQETHQQEQTYMKSKTELSANLSQKANQLISGISDFINKITSNKDKLQDENMLYKHFYQICENDFEQSKEQIKQLWEMAKNQNIQEERWIIWLQQTIKARDTRTNIQKNLISAHVSPPRQQNTINEHQQEINPQDQQIVRNEYQYRRGSTRSFTADKNINQFQANSPVSRVSVYNSRINVVRQTEPTINFSEGNTEKDDTGTQQKKIFQVSETKIVRPKQIVNMKSSDSTSMLGASKARRIEDSQHYQMVYDQAHTFQTSQTQYVNVEQQLKKVKQQGGTFQNSIDDISSEVSYPNVILLTSAQNQTQNFHNNYQPQSENEEQEYTYMKSKTELSATLSQKANQLISGISGFIKNITSKGERDPDENRKYKKFSQTCQHNFFQSREQIDQLWEVAKNQDISEERWNHWLQQTIKARDTRTNIQKNLISACVSPSHKQNIIDDQQNQSLSNREVIINNDYQYRRINTRSFTSDQNCNLQKKANSVLSGGSGFISRISVIPSTQPIIVYSEAQKKKFFDLAVRKKTQFNCNHPAQLIKIPDLYEKCSIENVPEEYWEQWIERTYSMAN